MNPERGEVEIELVGKTYILRPTYAACIEIERMTGGGLVPLARRVMSTEYGLGDAVAIVTAGLRAAGEPATADKVGHMVMETGLLNCAPALIKFLTNALSGGEEPGEAEAKAAETKSRTDDSQPSPTPA